MAYRIWFPFILCYFVMKQGFCDDKYKAGFSAGAECCKDFKNDYINAEKMDLAQMDSDDEEGAGAMCIEGSLELTMDVEEGAMIVIDIEKETDMGSEPMFSTSMGLCESIKDKDSPAKCIFEAMGIEQCPIKAGTYSVNNMTMDLSFCEDMLNDEFVGYYVAKAMITAQDRKVLSCHTLGLFITQ